jgi:hypothetical protein
VFLLPIVLPLAITDYRINHRGVHPAVAFPASSVGGDGILDAMASYSPRRNSLPVGGVLWSRSTTSSKRPMVPLFKVEAVEDIVTAEKRLISLASNGIDGYRIWDSTKEQFIDLLDDCA